MQIFLFKKKTFVFKSKINNNVEKEFGNWNYYLNFVCCNLDILSGVVNYIRVLFSGIFSLHKKEMILVWELWKISRYKVNIILVSWWLDDFLEKSERFEFFW